MNCDAEIVAGGLSPSLSSLALARAALEAEAGTIARYASRMGDEFTTALEMLHGARDAVIVSGIGKSGHIARKIASTFSSIGKPAIFLHPAEASHGDMGLVGGRSAALILSNSGETTELSDLIRYCRENAVPIVAVTAGRESTLGRHADAVLAYGRVREVCPNGLAPTTSTTLALAIGDALAVGLSHMIGTTPTDFHRYHPGGRLGARLTRVADLMHTGEQLPLVTPDLPMQEVVIVMSAKGFGVALVAEQGRARGIITDGDMRRNVERLWRARAGDLVQGPPYSVSADVLACEALELMNAHGVTCLAVEDDTGALVGLLHIHDCVRAGVEA